jgi:transcription initiation factor IIE alpha subunit
METASLPIADLLRETKRIPTRKLPALHKLILDTLHENTNYRDACILTDHEIAEMLGADNTRVNVILKMFTDEKMVLREGTRVRRTLKLQPEGIQAFLHANLPSTSNVA